MSDPFLRQIVKRIAMTGALTYVTTHLEELEAWQPGHINQVSEEEVERWLDDPEPNGTRDRAYKLAALLMGLEVADE